MERKYYTFAEAMNIVGNGGFVSRENYSGKMCIGLDKDEVVCVLSLNDEKPKIVDRFAPTMEEIKAEDWYIREDIQRKPVRTDDEISFDEELAEIKKALEAMGELEVDRRRFSIYYALMSALIQEGEAPEGMQQDYDEYREAVHKLFEDLESLINN